MVLDKAALADSMNLLTFVRWDRFIESNGKGVVYGWIDREDGRCDFVLLDFEQRPIGVAVGYSTSSASRSREIGQLLYGDNDEHMDCQRVDMEFGDLVANKVVLT